MKFIKFLGVITVITLSNVEKQYGDKLLFEKINISIYDGEKVGVVGSNGSGKSTLLKIIVKEESLYLCI